MAKLWARPVHGVLILAEGGGGAPGPLGRMLDPPLIHVRAHSNLLANLPHEVDQI